MENPNPNPAPDGGGSSNYKSIDELLKLAKVAIENTISQPDLSVPLAKKGYDSAELANAQTLHKKAEEFHLSQKDKYGYKFDAKDDFEKLKEEIDTEYTDHADLAKIALKNSRGDLEKLQLNGPRKRTISGWIGQVKAFYTNALSSDDIKAALLKKGVTEADLTANKAQLELLEKKEAEKFEKRGDAQNATTERNNAIEELSDWYKDFIDTAKVTFRKTPQLLEKLGVVVKS